MSPAPAPLYFCLRVPEFAAQALVRLRHALRKSAVAVLEGEPPLEKVCAATLQARRLGVHHGMTRTETESFPNLSILRRSATEEENAAATLLEMAGRFTPRAQQLHRSSALTLALDMTGSERILGSPHAIGQKLLRAARDLGFSARIAASKNLHTAACLVRAPGDTLTIVPPGEERALLSNIPLSALGLTDELADTFTAWGLHTAGDLAALPPIEIVSRLGEPGHRLLRLARGEEPHLFVPAEPVFTLQEHLAFDAPVDSLDSLLFALGPMLDQLIHRARTRALLLASITVHLHLERSADQTDRDRNREPTVGLQESVISTGARQREVERPAFAPAQATGGPSFAQQSRGPQQLAAGVERVGSSAAQPLGETANNPTHTRTLKPALPLDDRTLILKLLHLDLQAHPAPAAILAITLTADPGPRPGVQSGLFSPQLPEPMRLEVTVARLKALVGENHVGRVVLTDTHHSEAFRLEPLTFNEPTTGKHKQKPKPIDPTRTGIALRRLRPPKPIQLWKSNGQPHVFAFMQSTGAQTRYTVERAFGPWRQSGHWWSGAAWSLEEWDIDAIASDGTHLLCVLTHDLLQRQWQLGALYD